MELLAKIDACVGHIEPMLSANISGDFDAVKLHFKEITKAEHEADEIKNDIRDNLPRPVFLPIDRELFLDLLTSADQIADRAEDLGYLLTIRRTTIPVVLKPDFETLTAKALECYLRLTSTVGHLDQLIESGFKGPVADQVMTGIHEVCHLEWETDKVMYKLSQHLYSLEPELSPVDLFMLHDIARQLGAFADSAEKLAKHIRRTLAK